MADPDPAVAAAHAAARAAADALLLAHPCLRGVAVLLDCHGGGNDHPAAAAWATADAAPGPAAAVGMALVLARERGRRHAELRGHVEAAKQALTDLDRLRLVAQAGPRSE